MVDTVLDGNNLALNTNHELDFQIEQMIEKNEGLWKCKVCGNTTATKQSTQRHAERRIEGVSHVCHVCSKTHSTRHNRQDHISRYHSGLFSCDICGKSGMTRRAYHNHNRSHHKVLSVKD